MNKEAAGALERIGKLLVRMDYDTAKPFFADFETIRQALLNGVEEVSENEFMNRMNAQHYNRDVIFGAAAFVKQHFNGLKIIKDTKGD